MSEHEHGHEGHGDVAVEASGLPNLSIAGFVALTALVFFVSAASLPSLFYRIVDHMRGGQASAKVTDLKTLRSHETQRLSTYGYVDKGKGVVHIPIDVAMQKVVEDAKK
jgi:hypothetical protein